MSDVPESLNRLFRATSGEHSPADCDEYRAWLPSLVDDEMAGKETTRLYPQVLAHLDTCAECDEEYAALLDLALMEERGQLPQPATYPEVKLPRQIRLQRLVQQIARTTLNALDPRHVQELTLVAQSFFEQLAEAPGRFKLQSAAMPMGLGGLESATLPALMATYYALTTLLDRHSVAELQALARRGTFEKELQQTGRKEARRHNLRGNAERTFVDHFVKQVLADLPTLLDLASEQDRS